MIVKFWIAEVVGDPSGGGKLERDYGNCLSNLDGAGGRSHRLRWEACDRSGPSYEQSFTFIPCGADKVRIMHIGDGTCLETMGTSTGNEVRFEFCDPTTTIQEWCVPIYTYGVPFYVDN